MAYVLDFIKLKTRRRYRGKQHYPAVGAIVGGANG